LYRYGTNFLQFFHSFPFSKGEFAPEKLNPSLAKKGRGDFRTERRASYTTNFSSRTLGPHHAPENCRYHAASKVLGLTNPLALPFGGQPIMAHGVGAPSNHSSTPLYRGKIALGSG